MQKRLTLFIVVLFTTLQFPVLAQLNPDNLTVYDDIEGTSVNDVLTDRMGNVWMATQNGLVRFDGYEYKRYYPDPNDSTTLGSILTHRLFEDRKGNIWISCMDLISEYNPHTKSFINYNFSQLTNFPLYSQTVIPAISQDLNGRIYFGIASFLGFVANQALLYKEENEHELKRFQYPAGIEVQNVFRSTVDTKGNVWIVAINGFFKIEPDGNIIELPWPVGEFPADKSFNLVIESDNNGLLWISAPEATLTSWNPVTGAVRSYSMKPLFGNDIMDFQTNEMEIDSRGNIWMATNKGLVYFDRGKAMFNKLQDGPDQKLSRMEINCLNFDAFENLWMGTMQLGLLKYRERAVLKSFTNNRNNKTSITSGWATKLIEAGDGNIWISTSGGVGASGLNLLNPATQSITPLPFPEMLPGYESFNVIGALSPDNILIQANKENFIFNTTTKTVSKTKLDPALDSVYIHNIFTEKNGNLWFCTTNGAFLKSKNSKQLRQFVFSTMPLSNITSDEVVNMYEGEGTELWLLTNNGLYTYNSKTDKVKRHGYDRKKGDVFWSQDFNSFYEDSDGIAWVGTWGGGLSRYNTQTGKIKTYTTSDGLPSMSIQGILADEKNNALWISTFEGISRFSFLEEQFNNFSIKDGIQGRLFADGAYLKTEGGLFIFGGNNGITVFYPDDISKNSMPPKVFITGFKTGNTSLDKDLDLLLEHTDHLAGGIVLSYGQNSISIGYTGIHYDNPSQNQFAYKLENQDEDWRMVGNLRTAYYYNLPPGRYVFHVKAANSSGVWNDEGATLNIVIRAPWWRTWWAYLIYGLLLIGTIFLIDRFQRKRFIEKERSLAKEKELEQAREIEKAYHTLKTTQSQLIQSEKMASLGELAAGIAHEIQNPLNFVNNFSEVSRELIVEVKEELAVGPEISGLAKALLEDVEDNLEKITHHGKRADAIVKGMLQHSQSSAGIKEQTNINALADEYFRLAYHGFRAKDKSLNAFMETDFDKNIGAINIIPQDIGRVILNLITNAFYAVNEKKKKAGPEYKPTVILQTIRTNTGVELKVTDNGNGIPEKDIEKIFQPFFTTKPTGQGTGLGLSISYDIITKGHGGELKVETRVGKGTTISIILPLN